MVKKGIKIVVIALLVFALVFLAEQVVFAESTTVEDALKNNLKQAKYDDGTLFGVASRILGFFQWASIISGVIAITLIGIKYIKGSIEEKSEYKKEMVPLVVGIFVAMSAFTIARILFETFAGNTTQFDGVTDDLSGTYSDKSGASAIISRILGISQWVAIIGGVIAITILGMKYMLGSIQEKSEYKKSMIPLIVGIGVTMTAMTTANLLYKTFDKNVVYEWKECYICKTKILKEEAAYNVNTFYICNNHSSTQCYYKECENRVYDDAPCTGGKKFGLKLCHEHNITYIKCFYCNDYSKCRVYDGGYSGFHYACLDCIGIRVEDKENIYNNYERCDMHDVEVYYRVTLKDCPECHNTSLSNVIDEIDRGYSSTGGN